MPDANVLDPATVRLALGLMSGTSLDGIDAALLWTDGVRIEKTGPSATYPYDPALRDGLRGVLGGAGPVEAVERAVTEAHAIAVDRLLSEAGLSKDAIDVVGFHGHTILHRPNEGRTWQIGDGALLASLCGIDVVCDLRSNDVANGGQGAPIVPLYHRALARDLKKPVCILNIGGVANLTWIGAGEDDLIAFDTGPGNALLDEWTEAKTGKIFDEGGALARTGTVNQAILKTLMANPYFDAARPKSLDRIDFDLSDLSGLSPADGAATLTAFTCKAVARAEQDLPAPPGSWLVTGGGRHNPVMMDGLNERLTGRVEPVEAVGWNGDALEAQAFAYLAVRSLDGSPLTVPSTTGVSKPVTGGRLFRHEAE
ncbi:MAG: anhydro-N-acetylmuramic acid kinase [Proteobacteria bacterium]|nr:anhydro-N-acetylmuramic acid kinase [Pseudomonadota bacterium]